MTAHKHGVKVSLRRSVQHACKGSRGQSFSVELRRALNLCNGKQQKSITDYKPWDEALLMEWKNVNSVKTVNSSIHFRLHRHWWIWRKKKEHTHKKSPHYTPHLLASKPKCGCVGGRLAGNAVREASVTWDFYVFSLKVLTWAPWRGASRWVNQCEGWEVKSLLAATSIVS